MRAGEQQRAVTCCCVTSLVKQSPSQLEKVEGRGRGLAFALSLMAAQGANQGDLGFGGELPCVEWKLHMQITHLDLVLSLREGVRPELFVAFQYTTVLMALPDQ